MSDLFEKRIRAAVGAGWRTLVICMAAMLGSWVGFMIFLHVQPEWVRWLWGGGSLTWAEIQEVGIWFYGVFKMILLVFAAAILFLALWLRQLRRAQAGE